MNEYKNILLKHFMVFFITSTSLFSQQLKGNQYFVNNIIQDKHSIEAYNQINPEPSFNFNTHKELSKTTQNFHKFLIDSIVYLRNNGEKIKNSFEFDSHNRIILETSFFSSANNWIPYSRTSRIFDSFDNVIKETKEKYENGEWNYLTKSEKLFNNFNQRTYEAHFSWQFGKYEERVTHLEYDSNRRLILYMYKNIPSGMNWKYEYLYDTLGREKEIIKYNFSNGTYEQNRKWKYYYNHEYYSFIKKYWIWRDNDWLIESISSQLLDKYENILEEKYEYFHEDGSSSSSLHSYVFNDSLRVSGKSFELIDNQWELYLTSINEYDENNHEIFSIIQRWDNSLLISGQRRFLEYNSYGQQTLFKYESWINNSWFLETKTIHTYNETQNQLSFILTSYNYEEKYYGNYEVYYKYDVNQNMISAKTRILKDNILTSSELSKIGYDSQNRRVSIINFIQNKDRYEVNDLYIYEVPFSYNIESNFQEAYVYYLDGQQIVRSDQNIKPNYSIFQNYPNPFNPKTTISFSNSKLANIKISLFNSIGQKVKNITNSFFTPGTHFLNLDFSDLSSGTYFYRLEAEDFSQTKKMIILK